MTQLNDSRTCHSALHRKSRVAAVVPYWNCERWLFDCVESLVDQSRKLDAIIVVDDASDVSPLDQLRQFPFVTLMASPQTVGPYRLLQQIIQDTSFDAYMLNDADDWSSRHRLQALLEVAETAGAEMAGSYEVRVHSGDGGVELRKYPLDVNAVLLQNPTAEALLHGSSIFSRELVMRAGGFATGLRFSGDSEFLWRAAHVGRIIKIFRGIL